MTPKKQTSIRLSPLPLLQIMELRSLWKNQTEVVTVAIDRLHKSQIGMLLEKGHFVDVETETMFHQGQEVIFGDRTGTILKPQLLNLDDSIWYIITPSDKKDLEIHREDVLTLKNK